VGSKTNFFPSAVNSVEAYTTLKDPAPKGVDAVLNRNLTQSIAVVERQVNSVRSTFSTVSQIINDEGLEICGDIIDRASVLKEWRNINDSLEIVLVNSRDVANSGANLIRDFLATVIPYLLSDSDLKEKQRELGEYRETLKEGGECADLFANNFHEISCRVMEFKQKWATHSKETMKRLCTELERLGSDLTAAAESIDQTKQTFTSVLAQKRHDTRNEAQRETTKLLRRVVKDTKKAFKIQKKSETKVAKYAVEIREKTGDLVVVWNFIHDDIGIIEGQIRISEKGHSTRVFKERIEYLAVQYVHLMDSLQNYAKALSLAGKGPAPALPTISLWRRLLRLGNEA